jgi:translation elongation factor EF-Tu-like GTPase
MVCEKPRIYLRRRKTSNTPNEKFRSQGCPCHGEYIKNKVTGNITIPQTILVMEIFRI